MELTQTNGVTKSPLLGRLSNLCKRIFLFLPHQKSIARDLCRQKRQKQRNKAIMGDIYERRAPKNRADLVRILQDEFAQAAEALHNPQVRQVIARFGTGNDMRERMRAIQVTLGSIGASPN